jgi:hypothetical protein
VFGNPSVRPVTLPVAERRWSELPSRQEREYVLFADESVKDGVFFSNFYGGVLVGASQHDRVTRRLSALKSRLGMNGEVKWSKVTEQYLDRYIAFIDGFFTEVAAGNVKVRIMFSANADVAPEHVRESSGGYFKLYYQFIKHAFGLRFIPPRRGGTRLQLRFDEFPETGERVAQFKGFLTALGASSEFRHAGLKLSVENIAEVRSHDHVLLQALDVVLGGMAFRLNEMHRTLLPGQKRRGKRTKAKERLYRAMVAHVRRLRPNFNFGRSTGMDLGEQSLWLHPYRHWSFRPYGASYDRSKSKGGRQ